MLSFAVVDISQSNGFICSRSFDDDGGGGGDDDDNNKLCRRQP